jgi:perosamine synthetase
MVLGAPQPRARLYTTARAYSTGITRGLMRSMDDGSAVLSVERKLESIFLGCDVVAMPMARVGIYLVLKHTIRPGQKVILSPYTIADVVNMVVCAGGVPVFADIEAQGTCNIDTDAVIALLESECDVGAVLVTHFYGLACDVLRISAACKVHGVPLIEDAAQAFGTLVAGQPAGTIGDAGVFSFGLLKNVTGFVGGAVVTRNAELAGKLRGELSQFPVLPPGALVKKMAKGAAFDIATAPAVFDTLVYWLFRYAYLHGMDFFSNKLDTDANPVSYSDFPKHYRYRMSNASAEIISRQLSAFRQHTLRRIANATMYREGLRDLPDLVLPPHHTDGSHIYCYYPLQYFDRDKLARAMTRKGRDVQISHHRNCASMPCFASYARDCPNAERAASSVLYLPTYPGYRPDEINANIEAILSFFREGNSGL